MANTENQGVDNVAMKKFENDDDRLISFSKRRTSIYKKVNEISTLCDVEAGVLLFSPSGKSYTFGVPNIEVILNRFVQRNIQFPQNIIGPFDAYRKEKIERLNRAYNVLYSSRHMLKREEENLTKSKESIEEEFWWDAPLSDLTSRQLDRLSEAMERLKKVSTKKIEEILASNPSASGMNIPYVDLTELGQHDMLSGSGIAGGLDGSNVPPN